MLYPSALAAPETTMFHGERISLIIPALDEEGAIGGVIDGLDRRLVDEIIVVDNGAGDRTVARALEHGAVVVNEPRRGYGSACLAGIHGSRGDILGFMDGDGSDDPADLEKLLVCMRDTGADLVLGSRLSGRSQPGSLTVVQRFGNALTCALVRWFWGVKYTDLGPFRLVRREARTRLGMADTDYGFTIEMQVKAARMGLAVAEVPVSYRRRRAGRSKVSGNLVGSFMAGKKILGYVGAARLDELLRSIKNRGRPI